MNIPAPLWICAIIVLLLVSIEPVSAAFSMDQAKRMVTPNGVAFYVVGEKGEKPSPVLIGLALDVKTTLTRRIYGGSGEILSKRGYLFVTLDMICSGEDLRPGEPSGIEGWALRMEKGEDVVSDYVSRVRSIIDYLVKEGYADPEKIAICGTSRGGFLAAHIAATEPRIKCAACYIVAADLRSVREFEKLKDNPKVVSVALENLVDKLFDKPIGIWIGAIDTRVDTDKAISFARKLAAKAAAENKRPKIYLHVEPSAGHEIQPGGIEASAEWIDRQVRG